MTRPRDLPRVDDRLVLNGIWMLRSGVLSRDLSRAPGPWIEQMTHGGNGFIASSKCYRTKYIRSELPRTTSPTIGTINNQLVHTRSANRDGR